MPKELTTQTVPLLTPEEMRGVRTCLDLLQQAQSLCELAAQQLCPVRGFVKEWDKLEHPIAQIKYAWHDVETRRAWLLAMANRGTTPREISVETPTSADAKSGGRRSRKGDKHLADEFAPPTSESPEGATIGCPRCPKCKSLLRTAAADCDQCNWTNPL